MRFDANSCPITYDPHSSDQEVHQVGFQIYLTKNASIKWDLLWSPKNFDDWLITEDLVAGDDHAHISAGKCKNIVLRFHLSCSLTYWRAEKDCWETFSWAKTDGCSLCQIALVASERTAGVRLGCLVLGLLQRRFWWWFRICNQFLLSDEHDGDKCWSTREKLLRIERF